MIHGQHNAWLHALATVLVLAAGFLFRISTKEWGLIILAIIAVWTAEALNTAFEFLADITSPGADPRVMKAKDIAAAAVLVAATGALATGLLVFVPYLAELFR